MEKHGMSRTPEYIAWSDMKRRCSNPNHRNFSNWGGRGIRVCKSWQNSFLAFYKDMGPRPDGFTLERIDNDKGYCSSNCCWANYTTQLRNQRKKKTNSSGVSGVDWRRNRKAWRARIRTQKGRINLGHFSTLKEATSARKSAEKKYWL